jgi:hypothetical protein
LKFERRDGFAGFLRILGTEFRQVKYLLAIVEYKGFRVALNNSTLRSPTLVLKRSWLASKNETLQVLG